MQPWRWYSIRLPLPTEAGTAAVLDNLTSYQHWINTNFSSAFPGLQLRRAKFNSAECCCALSLKLLQVTFQGDDVATPCPH
jgi:hypothetical protein